MIELHQQLFVDGGPAGRTQLARLLLLGPQPCVLDVGDVLLGVCKLCGKTADLLCTNSSDLVFQLSQGAFQRVKVALRWFESTEHSSKTQAISSKSLRWRLRAVHGGDCSAKPTLRHSFGLGT